MKFNEWLRISIRRLLPRLVHQQRIVSRPRKVRTDEQEGLELQSATVQSATSDNPRIATEARIQVSSSTSAIDAGLATTAQQRASTRTRNATTVIELATKPRCAETVSETISETVIEMEHVHRNDRFNRHPHLQLGTRVWTRRARQVRNLVLAHVQRCRPEQT